MNETKIVVLAQEIGSDLSSRSRAAGLRARLLTDIAAGCDVVQVDFNGVRTISCSFADELFAVTVAINGEEWFRQHFVLKNLSGTIRRTILSSVADRLARRQIDKAITG